MFIVLMISHKPGVNVSVHTHVCISAEVSCGYCRKIASSHIYIGFRTYIRNSAHKLKNSALILKIPPINPAQYPRHPDLS
jgi:hypothetical protein